jgi:hypothetical protein
MTTMGQGETIRAKGALSGFLTNSRFFYVSRSVFWQAHPTTIRLLLGLASLGWFLCIATDVRTLYNTNYRYMWSIMPMEVWGTLFFLHFVGTFWRIFDPAPRVRWALFFNMLGCFLWFTMTIATNSAAGVVIPGSCLEIVTCAFAAWALIRTGLGKDVRTP